MVLAAQKQDEAWQVRKGLLNSFPRYAENCLKIQTVDGELAPFEFNEVQILLELIFQDMRDKGRLVRAIILKARREGASTYITGRFYHKTANDFNRYTVIIAHEPDSTDFLFKMVKRYQDNMLPVLKPLERFNNRKILEFNNDNGTGLDSAIRVGTAGKDDFGSGQLIHFLHISELAKWPRHTTTPLLTSVMQCVPANRVSEIVIESTAKGIGGEFYDRFWKARYRYEIFLNAEGVPDFKVTINEDAPKENEYSSIFVPWFVFGKYEMEPSTYFERVTKGHPLFETYGDEAALAGTYGLTNRKLQWRRWCILNNCNGNLATFQQEYPSNPEEAFVSTGSTLFNVPPLVLLKKKAPKPVARYECELSTGIWSAKADGRLKVWKEPVPGRAYLIGADVAEGIEGGDFNSADVVDWLSGEQVAQWHGHIAPDLYATILYFLGARYNWAYIACERNNHGMYTNDELFKLSYRNLHVETVHEPPFKPRKRVGWVTG